MRTLQMISRPSERVRQYLLQELHCSEDTARLPGMRQLAVELDVSLTTVQAVYRQLKSEGRIATRAGSGAFLLRTPLKPAQTEFRVVLNSVLPEGSLDNSIIGKIYAGMLHAGIHQGKRTSFTSLRDQESPIPELQSLFSRGEVDGIIIFPTGQDVELAHYCQTHQIPYAGLRPPHRGGNTNFVSAEHFLQGQTIGRAFATGNRRKIAFFTPETPAQSTSAWELLSGITCGMIETASECNMMLFNPPAGALKTPECESSAIRQWLAERKDKLPDAIYSQRTRYAIPIIQAMKELGYTAPNDFGFITHEDVYSPSPANAHFTRAGASFEAIGRALVDLLIERIQNGAQDRPATQISAAFGGGETTSAAENQILGIQ